MRFAPRRLTPAGGWFIESQEVIYELVAHSSHRTSAQFSRSTPIVPMQEGGFGREDVCSRRKLGLCGLVLPPVKKLKKKVEKEKS